jgi:hypothetical protein
LRGSVQSPPLVPSPARAPEDDEVAAVLAAATLDELDTPARADVSESGENARPRVPTKGKQVAARRQQAAAALHASDASATPSQRPTRHRALALAPATDTHTDRKNLYLQILYARDRPRTRVARSVLTVRCAARSRGEKGAPATPAATPSRTPKSPATNTVGALVSETTATATATASTKTRRANRSLESADADQRRRRAASAGKRVASPARSVTPSTPAPRHATPTISSLAKHGIVVTPSQRVDDAVVVAPDGAADDGSADGDAAPLARSASAAHYRRRPSVSPSPAADTPPVLRGASALAVAQLRAVGTPDAVDREVAEAVGDLTPSLTPAPLSPDAGAQPAPAGRQARVHARATARKPAAAAGGAPARALDAAATEVMADLRARRAAAGAIAGAGAGTAAGAAVPQLHSPSMGTTLMRGRFLIAKYAAEQRKQAQAQAQAQADAEAQQARAAAEAQAQAGARAAAAAETVVRPRPRSVAARAQHAASPGSSPSSSGAGSASPLAAGAAGGPVRVSALRVNTSGDATDDGAALSTPARAHTDASGHVGAEGPARASREHDPLPSESPSVVALVGRAGAGAGAGREEGEGEHAQHEHERLPRSVSPLAARPPSSNKSPIPATVPSLPTAASAPPASDAAAAHALPPPSSSTESSPVRVSVTRVASSGGAAALSSPPSRSMWRRTRDPGPVPAAVPEAPPSRSAGSSSASVPPAGDVDGHGGQLDGGHDAVLRSSAASTTSAGGDSAPTRISTNVMNVVVRPHYLAAPTGSVLTSVSSADSSSSVSSMPTVGDPADSAASPYLVASVARKPAMSAVSRSAVSSLLSSAESGGRVHFWSLWRLATECERQLRAPDCDLASVAQAAAALGEEFARARRVIGPSRMEALGSLAAADDETREELAQEEALLERTQDLLRESMSVVSQLSVGASATASSLPVGGTAPGPRSVTPLGASAASVVAAPPAAAPAAAPAVGASSTGSPVGAAAAGPGAADVSRQGATSATSSSSEVFVPVPVLVPAATSTSLLNTSVQSNPTRAAGSPALHPSPISSPAMQAALAERMAIAAGRIVPEHELEIYEHFGLEPPADVLPPATQPGPPALVSRPSRAAPSMPSGVPSLARALSASALQPQPPHHLAQPDYEQQRVGVRLGVGAGSARGGRGQRRAAQCVTFVDEQRRALGKPEHHRQQRCRRRASG